MNPDRDPRIDPQPGDTVDMMPNVAKGKWVRFVTKVECGSVHFWAWFHGTLLSPMTDSIDEWREATKQRHP